MSDLVGLIDCPFVTSTDSKSQRGLAQLITTRRRGETPAHAPIRIPGAIGTPFHGTDLYVRPHAGESAGSIGYVTTGTLPGKPDAVLPVPPTSGAILCYQFTASDRELLIIADARMFVNALRLLAFEPAALKERLPVLTDMLHVAHNAVGSRYEVGLAAAMREGRGSTIPGAGIMRLCFVAFIRTALPPEMSELSTELLQEPLVLSRLYRLETAMREVHYQIAQHKDLMGYLWTLQSKKGRAIARSEFFPGVYWADVLRSMRDVAEE